MRLPHPSNPQALPVSLDGYLRMTFDAFSQLDFNIRRSWDDTDLGEELRLEGINASGAGYCEWQAEAIGSVSIGWAWFDPVHGRRTIAPGGISTNVMLLAQKGRYDLGPARTSALLEGWLATRQWTKGKANRIDVNNHQAY